MKKYIFVGLILLLPIVMASNIDIVKRPNPATLPANTGRAVEYSPDGAYLAVGHVDSPYITIYDTTDYSKLADPASLPASDVWGVSWSPDGAYLATAHLTTPFITIYRTSDWVKLADPAVLPTGDATRVAYSPDGAYLAVSHDVTPFVTIYSVSGETYTKVTNPATLPANNANGVAWTPGSEFLAVAHFDAPCLTVYQVSGWTKINDPASPPDSNFCNSVGFSPSGDLLAVGQDIKSDTLDATAPLFLYEFNNGIMTKVQNPGREPSGIVRAIKWTPDETLVAMGTENAPYMALYADYANAFSKLDNPAILPNGIGFDVAWKPDQSELAVANGFTPFVTIYNVTGMTGDFTGAVVESENPFSVIRDNVALAMGTDVDPANWLLGMLVIGACILFAGFWGKGDPLVIGLGTLLGAGISLVLGFIQVWGLLTLLLLIVAAFVLINRRGVASG